MTYPEAIRRAAAEAIDTTVDEPWGEYAGRGFGLGERGWFRRRLRRWRPTSQVRTVAIDEAKAFCQHELAETGDVPSQRDCEAAVSSVVDIYRYGVGPLTWLWIAVMVARLLVSLKQLLREEGK